MDQQHVKTVTIIMTCFVACALICKLVVLWRGAQHDKAAQRVRDRLDQETYPEGFARRQARQARESALIAEELATMRRASWYGRLLHWWRQTDQVQG